MGIFKTIKNIIGGKGDAEKDAGVLSVFEEEIQKLEAELLADSFNPEIEAFTPSGKVSTFQTEAQWIQYMQDVQALKGMTVEFMYECKNLKYVANNGKWKVVVGATKGYSDRGYTTKTHQKSFATKEDAIAFYEKLQTKQWLMEDEEGNIIAGGNNWTEEEKKLISAFASKHCPNMMGTSF